MEQLRANSVTLSNFLSYLFSSESKRLFPYLGNCFGEKSQDLIFVNEFYEWLIKYKDIIGYWICGDYLRTLIEQQPIDINYIDENFRAIILMLIDYLTFYKYFVERLDELYPKIPPDVEGMDVDSSEVHRLFEPQRNIERRLEVQRNEREKQRNNFVLNYQLMSEMARDIFDSGFFVDPKIYQNKYEEVYPDNIPLIYDFILDNFDIFVDMIDYLYKYYPSENPEDEGPDIGIPILMMGSLICRFNYDEENRCELLDKLKQRYDPEDLLQAESYEYFDDLSDEEEI